MKPVVSGYKFSLTAEVRTKDMLFCGFCWRCGASPAPVWAGIRESVQAFTEPRGGFDASAVRRIVIRQEVTIRAEAVLAHGMSPSALERRRLSRV